MTPAAPDAVGVDAWGGASHLAPHAGPEASFKQSGVELVAGSRAADAGDAASPGAMVPAQPPVTTMTTTKKGMRLSARDNTWFQVSTEGATRRYAEVHQPSQ